MKRLAYVAVMVMAMAAMVAGCKRHGNAPAQAQAAPPTTTMAMKPMALVDIAKIVKAMGWNAEIQEAVYLSRQQLQTDRDQQLADLYHKGMAVREQIVKEAKLNAAQAASVLNLQNAGQLDDLPLTDAQRQKLVSSSVQTNLQAEQIQRDYQHELAARAHELGGGYRDRILSAANRVAAEDGFRTIIADSSDVLYHDPSTDVSQQVIDAMTRDKPKWEQPGGK